MNVHQEVEATERESLIVRVRQRPVAQQVALGLEHVALTVDAVRYPIGKRTRTNMPAANEWACW